MNAPINGLRRWRLLGYGALLLLLAGCGVTTGGTAGAENTPSSTTSTTPVASSGCPASAQNVSWPTAPVVVVTTQSQGTTTIKVGQTLEIAMPYGSRWALASDAASGPFTLNAPAGYPDDQLSACVWHFTAAKAGTQDVDFTRSALCAPHSECPQSIVEFTVSIAATN